jgi:hypothetical protein
MTGMRGAMHAGCNGSGAAEELELGKDDAMVQNHTGTRAAIFQRRSNECEI